MTSAKIQISIGAITFSGEGTEEWLEKQLDKLLASAPTLATIHPIGDTVDEGGPGTTGLDLGTLATYIQKKAAGTNQVRRFLATADWLHAKGAKRLQTKDISKALSDANQKKLSNPADCLGQNVAKGHCEKDGGSFYVTPEGKAALA